MNNRGYYDNRGGRRRPRKRVTGRFYAFMSVLVVLVVMMAVFFSTRGDKGKPAISVPTPAPVTQAPVVTPQPTDSVVPAPGADLNGDDSLASTGDEPVQPAATQSGSGSIKDLLAGDDGDEDLPPVSESEKVQAQSDFNAVQGLDPDWRNILLLGSDARELSDVSRTDTIMIASINTKDGRIKLTSIMRDTIVPIPQKDGSTIYQKINAASRYGGPELTVQIVNDCFQMNITEYALVNFASFREIVDILGGIEVDVTKEEQEWINRHVHEQVMILEDRADWGKVNYNLETFGKGTHLTGMQALAYSRIRHIDSDYQRTERQRTVIEAILAKVRKDVSIGQLMNIGRTLFGQVKTNISFGSAISLATTVLTNGLNDISMSGRIPANGTYVSETRNGASALYDVDYQANATKLHDYIYNK